MISLVKQTRSINFSLIKGLHIRNQTLNYVPEFYNDLEERLELLYITLSNLKEIGRHELKRYPNLRALSLEDNDLTWLSADSFDSTLKLEWINISGNQLKYVGPSILIYLKNLKRVWFDDSGCIHLKANQPYEVERLQEELDEKCATDEMLKKMISEHEMEDLKPQKTERSINPCQLQADESTRIKRSVDLLKKILRSARKSTSN